MRSFSMKQFDAAFVEMMTGVTWQEEPQYYPRYRERYLAMLRQFADMASEDGLDILEIDGGQLAFLTTSQ